MTRGTKIAAAASASFSTLVMFIIVLLANRVVTPQLALLLVIALIALCFGLGVLVWIYRLVARLE